VPNHWAFRKRIRRNRGKRQLRLFELARVLVRFDHVDRIIVNAMTSTGCAAEREKTERELLTRARYETILYL
jgi:hypothetical protein